MPVNSYENYMLTWRPDKNKLNRPIYKSLVRQLEDDILSNKLQENTQLPSQRELADYLDLNFTTVGQAYKYAIGKELLYTNTGSGTFVSPHAFDSITISNNKVAEHIIDFGLVSSFDQCNDLIDPFIQSISQNTNITGLLNYQEPRGTNFQLRTALNWLQTQGVDVNLDEIAIVSGVQNGLAVVLSALFSPGDRIVVDRYTYSNFIELAHLYHLEVVPVEFDAQGMLPDALQQECRKKKIHGIFLMPSCNNPMGFQMTIKRRNELANIIIKEGLWVIEDDIHSFLTTYFQNKIVLPFQNLIPEQTVYLAGMTKFICSGLRVAYLVFPEKVKDTVERAIFNINVKTSGLDAEIVTQVLLSSTSREILEIKADYTKKANQIFDDFFDLPRPSNPYPYYRIIPIDPNFSQKEIEQSFLAKGIRIYHSNRFTSQKQSDAFIRVSLSSNHLDILEKGLKIIQKEIDPYL